MSTARHFRTMEKGNGSRNPGGSYEVAAQKCSLMRTGSVRMNLRRTDPLPLSRG